MAPKTIKNNHELSKAIKDRRNELNLTIDEASSKAGLGSKTWQRYESGGSIRKDKVKGLCRTLNWKVLPNIDNNEMRDKENISKYKKNEAWSPYLEKRFGKYAAISFIIGSELLLDMINADIDALSGMPKGSHIGEISFSAVSDILPREYLTRYDYEFMWNLRRTLIQFRRAAPITRNLIAYSVIDELVLYLIMDESRAFIEDMNIEFDFEDDDEYIDCREWAFDMFDDMDVVTCLYSDFFRITPDHTYHFDNWYKEHFWVSEE